MELLYFSRVHKGPELHDTDRNEDRYSRPPEAQPPHRLYKYTTIDAATELLESNKLKFSSPLEYNDPFDCRWDICWELYEDCNRRLLYENLTRAIDNPGDCPKGTTECIQRAHAAHHEILKSRSRDERLLYIKRLADDMLKAARGVPDSDCYILAPWKLCCFSEVDSSNLMWSHYSAMHKGVVLGFDTSMLKNAMELPFSKVEYDTAPPLTCLPSQRMQCSACRRQISDTTPTESITLQQILGTNLICHP